MELAGLTSDLFGGSVCYGGGGFGRGRGRNFVPTQIVIQKTAVEEISQPF
jgi:hypothetical protein